MFLSVVCDTGSVVLFKYEYCQHGGPLLQFQFGGEFGQMEGRADSGSEKGEDEFSCVAPHR